MFGVAAIVKSKTTSGTPTLEIPTNINLEVAMVGTKPNIPTNIAVVESISLPTNIVLQNI